MNPFISQKRSILSIGSFIKVDQHKMYHPNIENSIIFDDIKIFPNGNPRKKSSILDLPHIWKMPKGHEVALISFTIWRASRDYSIKKVHAYATFRFHPVAPGLYVDFYLIIFTLK